MRRERLYLLDMIEAAEAIARFMRGMGRADFLNNELVQSAVLQKLALMGEAAAHLSRELRERHSGIEWRDIVAFRNIAIHEYFAVDWEIVWTAATVDAPLLRAQVSRILEES